MVLEALRNNSASASPIVYKSFGNALLIGRAGLVDEALAEFPASLKPFVLLTNHCPSDVSVRLVARGISFVDDSGDISISGFLGEFRLNASRNNHRFCVNRQLLGEDRWFDLVIDFQASPSISRTTVPFGYYRFADDIDGYRQMIDELADMVGEFEKPKFFQFHASLCAHDRNKVDGCRRCLNACPAEAIQSAEGRIEIDPYLCQGCGNCVSTCPSGAVNYQYPSRTDTLNRLRRLLIEFSSTHESFPFLVVHEADDHLNFSHTGLAGNIALFPVESLASFGIEMWLAALAYGAKQVRLLAPKSMESATRCLLQSQMAYAHQLIAPIGLGPKVIDWMTGIGITNSDTSVIAPGKAAKFAGVEDKRKVVRMAVDFLAHSACQTQSVDLAEGAPFGEIIIDSDACTLCMACVSICPEAALQDGHDQPQLKFIESNCVQCGLCANVCPEQAIRLKPRYLYDSNAARQTRVIHEDAVFHCIECGKGFATKSMIENMLDKLASHSAFQGDAIERLKMCETCRVKVMF